MSKNPEIVYWFLTNPRQIPLMIEEGKITKEEVKIALDYIKETLNYPKRNMKKNWTELNWE